MPPSVIYGTYLVLFGVYVLWKGGAPERIAAIAWIAGSELSYLFVRSTSNRYSDVEWGVFLVDALLFGVFLALAFGSRRWWPVWLAACQLAESFVHLAKFAAPTIDPRAYYWWIVLWGYPTSSILLAATWRHRRRLKLMGADAPWSPSFERFLAQLKR